MHPVFNTDQCEGLDPKYYPEPGAPVEEIAKPEAVLAAYDASPGAAQVFYDVRGEAYYDPAADRIHMPSRDGHASAERYYATGFHERVHWWRWPMGVFVKPGVVARTATKFLTVGDKSTLLICRN